EEKSAKDPFMGQKRGDPELPFVFKSHGFIFNGSSLSYKGDEYRKPGKHQESSKQQGGGDRQNGGLRIR
ncbi:MAG TPA: hypothetical protein VGO18_13405, partial [Steroidobacteraceae bacterium]|nr:hypothetical protein [Steroidobacteraceae bacterium]